MMRIKKFLALLLSAALALTLLAGCGSQSLRQLLLDLLQGQYSNVTVKAGPAMEDILRQAVNQGGTMEEIDDALQDALQPTVSFDSLWNATSQDNAYDLAYYKGTDAQAIAHQAYTAWNTALNTLPSGSRYVADFATLQSGGGYYLLVSVAGGDSHSVTNSDGGTVYPDDDTSVSEGLKPEDSDEPEEGEEGHGPRGPKSFVGFERVGEDGLTYVVKSSEGLNNLLFNDKTDFWLNLDRDGGEDDDGFRHDGNFVGVTIELAANSEPYTLDQQIEGFRGTLTSADGGTAIIEVSEQGVIGTLNGEVSNINFTVTENITKSCADFPGFSAAAVAEVNQGKISNCNVNFNDCGIEVSSSDSLVQVGGLVGYNLGGTIENCHVTNVNIITNLQKGEYQSYGQISVGGLVGDNGGTMKNCSASGRNVQLNISPDLTGNEMSSLVAVGGLVGYSTKPLTNCTSSVSNVSVTYGTKTYRAGEVDYDNFIVVGNVHGFPIET